MEPSHIAQVQTSLAEDRNSFGWESSISPGLGKIISEKRRVNTEKSAPITAQILKNTRVDIAESRLHLELLMAILDKHPGKRSVDELKFIREAFNNVSFFEKIEQQIGEEQTIRLINRLTFERFAPGERVFEAGDWGEQFYIIIKGEVYILLERRKEEENGPKIIRNDDARKDEVTNDSEKGVFQDSQFQQRAPQKNRDKLSESPQDWGEKFHNKREVLFNADEAEDGMIQKLSEFYPNFFVSKTLRVGDSFGEIALQHRVRRTATVVCKKETIFCSLSRTDFNQLLGNTSRLDEENLQILEHNALFSHMPRHELTNIYLQLFVKSYPRGHIFYKEGQPAENFYIVRSGEVEITKLFNAVDIQNFQKELNLEGIRSSEHKLKKKNSKSQRPIRLETLSKGNFFGFEELFTRQPRAKTAVVCSPNTSVFEITHKVTSEYSTNLTFSFFEQQLFNIIISDREVKEKLKQLLVVKKARTEEVMYQMLKQQLKVAEKLSAIRMNEFKLAFRNNSLSDSINQTSVQSSDVTAINDLSVVTSVKPIKEKKTHFNLNIHLTNSENTGEQSTGLSSNTRIMISSPKVGLKLATLQSPSNKSLLGKLEDKDDAEDSNAENEHKLMSQRQKKIKSLSLNEHHEKLEQEAKDTYFHKAIGIKQQTNTKVKIARNLSEASLLSNLKKGDAVEDRMKKDFNYDGLNLMTFLTPKASIYAIQKANLERKFEVGRKKYITSPVPTAFDVRQKSFINKSERERIIDLCKMLRLKHILPSKQLEQTPDPSNRQFSPKSQELSSIIASVRRSDPSPLKEEQSSLISNKIVMSNRLSPMKNKQSPVANNLILITVQEPHELTSPIMNPVFAKNASSNNKIVKNKHIGKERGLLARKNND